MESSKAVSCDARRQPLNNLLPAPRRTLPGSFEMKILIADDEPVSRRMLQGLLAEVGL